MFILFWKLLCLHYWYWSLVLWIWRAKHCLHYRACLVGVTYISTYWLPFSYCMFSNEVFFIYVKWYLVIGLLLCHADWYNLELLPLFWRWRSCSPCVLLMLWSYGGARTEQHLSWQAFRTNQGYGILDFENKIRNEAYH